MRRSMLPALAGSLTLLAGVAAPGLAQAADLLPARPMPMPAPIVDVGSGWYLRGDVGVGVTDYGKAVLNPISIAPDGYQVTDRNISEQFFAGGGIGYQVNSFLRGEVTGEYRGGSRLSYVEKYPGAYYSTGYQADYNDDGTVAGIHPYHQSSPGTGIDYNQAHLSSVVVMASGLIDIGTWYCLTPYFGGGVGAAFNHISGWNDIGAGTAAGGFGTARDKDTTSFAWNLQAGISYAVTPNFKVDVGYRYIDLGHAQTGKVVCNDDGCGDSGHYSYKFKDITSQDIKIGLRYLIGTAAPAPMLPLGPVVSKY